MTSKDEATFGGRILTEPGWISNSGGSSFAVTRSHIMTITEINPSISLIRSV